MGNSTISVSTVTSGKPRINGPMIFFDRPSCSRLPSNLFVFDMRLIIITVIIAPIDAIAINPVFMVFSIKN